MWTCTRLRSRPVLTNAKKNDAEAISVWPGLKDGITPGVLRPLPRKNTLRLIHKIEPVWILWMSRSTFLPSNQRIIITLGMIPTWGIGCSFRVGRGSRRQGWVSLFYTGKSCKDRFCLRRQQTLRMSRPLSKERDDTSRWSIPIQLNSLMLGRDRSGVKMICFFRRLKAESHLMYCAQCQGKIRCNSFIKLNVSSDVIRLLESHLAFFARYQGKIRSDSFIKSRQVPFYEWAAAFFSRKFPSNGRITTPSVFPALGFRRPLFRVKLVWSAVAWGSALARHRFGTLENTHAASPTKHAHKYIYSPFITNVQ